MVEGFKGKLTFSTPPEEGNKLSQQAYDLISAMKEGAAMTMEMFKAVTQPAPAPQPGPMKVFNDEPGEEDELGPGVLDMRSIWSMSPEGREAVLSNYGLAVATPPSPEPDKTAEVMRGLTGEGAKGSIQAEESEE